MEYPKLLQLELNGTAMKRQDFLRKIRIEVMRFTGRGPMRLDALINEIAKNIYDHANKRGYLEIKNENDVFPFLIKDHGESSYVFEKCMGNSTKVGNGINCNLGLQMILDFASTFKIDLKIDTSKGFSYFGVYDPKKTEECSREEVGMEKILKEV